ncbi:carbohydrate sulfotransferase 8-like [Gigantopelta aegis]|uniref:carbohydrate sulfotransferase 8-like n=1 Tax=Gigantopelta aegis TaxID=1735272 RepID=UPI001B88949B|nr:carbohydrate sulfotransferase 8-like [Gigantopelta aegis]
MRRVEIRHKHVICSFVIVIVFSTASVIWIQRQDYYDQLRSNEYQHAKAMYKKKLRRSELFDNRFQERQQRLVRACTKYSNFDVNGTIFRPEDVLFVPPYNMSICVIQKVGCRFWWKVLTFLQNSNTKKHTSDPYRLSNLTDNLKSSFERSLKIVFTREPYSRLLAAYVDKFLSPNPFFWGTGKIIINRFRHDASKRSLECGHDVSFQEYVKYVLDVEHVYDPHFIPMHRHCAFCKQRYDIIGKMETFQDDVSFIIHLVNASSNAQLLHFINSNHILKEIRVNAKNLFLTRKRILKACMNMHEALRRLWKRWKIRGFISNDQNLNISAEQSETMSFYTFYDLAIQAVKRSNSLGRRFTMNNLKQEYFNSLPISDKLSLRELFRPEFDMFGYNPKPAFVFPVKK